MFDPRPSSTPEELEAAAQHWDKLADDEQDRLTWDKYALKSCVDSRVRIYRRTAEALRHQAATGEAICSCCHKPVGGGPTFLNVG